MLLAAAAPPCAVVLPIILLPFVALAVPAWLVAIALIGLLWLLTLPLDWIARARGGERSALRARLTGWLRWLKYPTWPERWTRR